MVANSLKNKAKKQWGTQRLSASWVWVFWALLGTSVSAAMIYWGPAKLLRLQTALSEGKRVERIVKQNSNASLDEVGQLTLEQQLTPAAGDATPKDVAILVLGLGNDAQTTEAALNLPAHVTLGIDAGSQMLDYWLSKAAEKGHQVVLQLPEGVAPESTAQEEPKKADIDVILSKASQAKAVYAQSMDVFTKEQLASIKAAGLALILEHAAESNASTETQAEGSDATVNIIKVDKVLDDLAKGATLGVNERVIAIDGRLVEADVLNRWVDQLSAVNLAISPVVNAQEQKAVSPTTTSDGNENASAAQADSGTVADKSANAEGATNTPVAGDVLSTPVEQPKEGEVNTPNGESQAAVPAESNQLQQATPAVPDPSKPQQVENAGNSVPDAPAVQEQNTGAPAVANSAASAIAPSVVAPSSDNVKEPLPELGTPGLSDDVPSASNEPSATNK